MVLKYVAAVVIYRRGETMNKKELIAKEIEQAPRSVTGRGAGLRSIPQEQANRGKTRDQPAKRVLA